jgi:hypothetical protein
MDSIHVSWTFPRLCKPIQRCREIPSGKNETRLSLIDRVGEADGTLMIVAFVLSIACARDCVRQQRVVGVKMFLPFSLELWVGSQKSHDERPRQVESAISLNRCCLLNYSLPDVCDVAITTGRGVILQPYMMWESFII